MAQSDLPFWDSHHSIVQRYNAELFNSASLRNIICMTIWWSKWQSFVCLSPGILGPGGPGVAFCPSLHRCWCRDLAGIFSQALWGAKNSHVYIRSVPHPLRFHKDIGETHTHTNTHPKSVIVITCYICMLNSFLFFFLNFTPQADIFSGALFIQVSLGWDLYLSTGILLLVTAAYTVTGKKKKKRCSGNRNEIEM